jgi:hypothetical protein
MTPVSADDDDDDDDDDDADDADDGYRVVCRDAGVEVWYSRWLTRTL